MLVLGLLLVVGIVVTVWWGGTAYEPWEPAGVGGPRSTARPSSFAVLRYLRGVAVALVGGFWAGILVTGPAIRLIMRLLAATAGDGAQGAITEAEEVVGDISLGGTIGLLSSAASSPACRAVASTCSYAAGCRAAVSAASPSVPCTS